MKHRYHIEKRASLWAAFGMICFASMLVSPSAWAQSGCVIIDGVRACPVGPEPGGSGGGYSGPNLWNMLKKSGPSAAEKAEQQARDVNNLGVQAYNQGDWATAITYFNQALQKFPNEPIYQKNLANAQTNLADQQAKEKAEREAMERQRQNKVAADNMQQSIQNFAQTLNAAPVSGGLDFDGRTIGNAPAGNNGGLDFTATVTPPGKSAATLSFGDPMVVDARNVPSGLDQATENAIAKAYANAPPGVSERVRKGFQAVRERDWKVAKAWFEDALSRDPGNPGLNRMIVLADYSLSDRQTVASGYSGSVPAPSKAEIDEFFRNFREGRKFTPTDKVRNYVLNLSNEEFKNSIWESSLQLPTDADILLMFPGEPPGSSAPAQKPDGRVLQLPTDADVLLMFPGEPPGSLAPARQPTPTFIIGKEGQLIQVPENSDQESPTYIKGKDGKLIEVPQPKDLDFFGSFGNSPEATSTPAVESGKAK